MKIKKVILAKTVSEIHNTRLLDVDALVNSNIEEFEFSVDILI